jgi:hypothetical protein
VRERRMFMTSLFETCQFRDQRTIRIMDAHRDQHDHTDDRGCQREAHASSRGQRRFESEVENICG